MNIDNPKVKEMIKKAEKVDGDLGTNFTELVLLALLLDKQGSERFTDQLVGDETITVCAECGREKIDE